MYNDAYQYYEKEYYDELSDGKSYVPPEVDPYYGADYPVVFETSQLGPYLYINLEVWDLDTPELFDDNEMLGNFSWYFNSNDLKDISSSNKLVLEKTTEGHA